MREPFSFRSLETGFWFLNRLGDALEPFYLECFQTFFLHLRLEFRASTDPFAKIKEFLCCGSLSCIAKRSETWFPYNANDAVLSLERFRPCLDLPREQLHIGSLLLQEIMTNLMDILTKCAQNQALERWSLNILWSLNANAHWTIKVNASSSKT